MNKSIEYVKERINNSTDNIGGGGIPLTGWEDAIIINPMNIFKSGYDISIENNKINYELFMDNNKNKRMKTTIEYDNKADYDYFTSKFIKHDGTLLFQIQAMSEMLNKFFSLKTYSKKKAPNDFENNPFNYDIKYTIGDILINSDYGIKEINGREMTGQRDVIVLPIKFEVFKH